MYDILPLCGFAFLAGFIDSIVGGGGLIQTPAMLITLPHQPVAAIMGTAKISSIAGSSMSSWQYSRHVDLRWRVLAATGIAALTCSFLGARLISYLDPALVKPVIWVLLVVVFIYLWIKKDFGQFVRKAIPERQAMVRGVLFGSIAGLYDGFLGPGTGSFLILFFISAIGYDFLNASAHAKFINLLTNIGAVIYFVFNGYVLWHIALPMAACNLSGSYLGTKAALLRGNAFVRVFFLCVMALMIGRYGWDIFYKKF
jgi:uncharacterized protein